MNISWKGAILISIVSFTISFLGFLVYETIWGDILRELLDPNAKKHPYMLINLILHVGLFSVLGVSLVVGLFIYKNFTFKSKLVANLLTIVMTIVVLFILSFGYMFILFSNLTTIQILGIWPLYFAYFSIYILPNPIYFWFIALIIYHIFLTIFNKMFLTRNTYYFKKKVRKSKSKKLVYKSRVIK